MRSLKYLSRALWYLWYMRCSVGCSCHSWMTLGCSHQWCRTTGIYMGSRYTLRWNPRTTRCVRYIWRSLRPGTEWTLWHLLIKITTTSPHSIGTTSWRHTTHIRIPRCKPRRCHIRMLWSVNSWGTCRSSSTTQYCTMTGMVWSHSRRWGTRIFLRNWQRLS